MRCLAKEIIFPRGASFFIFKEVYATCKVMLKMKFENLRTY